MYNKNLFEKDYKNISSRIVKLLCDFPSIDPIFKQLEAAINFAKEKGIDHNQLGILLLNILEPNLDEINNFFDYYKESITLINKFFEDYNDYRDKEVDGWIGAIIIINDCLVFYNAIITNFKIS